MRFEKLIKNSIVCVLAVTFLAGCGEKSVSEVTVTESAKTYSKSSMLSEPSLDYEVPVANPIIIVDMGGYELLDEKTALIVTENIPRSFAVCDSSNDSVVYEGTVRIKAIEDEGEDEIDTGLIDFSDFCEPGKYYIKTNLYGRSLDFEVLEGRYQKLFDRAKAGLDNKRCTTCHSEEVPFESNLSEYKDVSGGWHTNNDCEKDVVEGCLAVMDICTMYEYYPALFADSNSDGIADIIDDALFETEWLFKMQNPGTGGVYTSVTYQQVAGSDKKQLVIGGETTRATAYFCACMAKVSYTIGRIDSIYASKAIQAAGMAWKCLEANRGIVSDDQMFRAAVEMYRATGYAAYSDVVDEYLKANSDKEYEGRTVLDGAVTYLDTQRRTNVDYCTHLMANFMSRTEKKVQSADSNRYSVESLELSTSDILRNAYEMILVEYIISSNAYTTNEKDCLHYLCGRNESSRDLLSNDLTPDDYVKVMCVAAKLNSD